MLTLYEAVRALECLCAVSLLIQTSEFLRMQSIMRTGSVWDWQIQRQELAHARPWLQNLAGFLFRPEVHRAHLILRLMTSASLLIGVNLATSIFLFVSTVVLLIRWRGAFNGGSDFMTVVTLTGMLIAQLAAPWTGAALGWKAGLWYISIHTMSSYFISGSVKLFDRNWRNGRALPFFLDGGVYGPLAEDSLLRRRPVALLCSWAFILWECSFPLVLAGPVWAALWCLVAAVFHFLVFWHFGLNRFFWAWCTTFPAIIYCSAQW
jgi:hypothetical protein